MLELYILGGFLLLVVVAIPLYFIGAALYQRKQDKENANQFIAIEIGMHEEYE